MPSLVEPTRSRITPASPLVLAFACAGLGVIAVHAVFDLTAVSVQDFVEYWAAGRLNINGQDAYDPATLYAQELHANATLTEAIMMWNPPWTLTLPMPFGVLPARIGFVLWLGMNLTLVLIAAGWLWTYFGGRANERWLGCAISLVFAPTVFVLRMGQISPVVLMGIVGFLYFEKQERWAWAGAALALTAVKPHLVFFVGLAVVCWTLQTRRWSILGGGGLALALLSAAPLACNPQVFAQFHDALTRHPPRFLSPTPGSLLRLAFGVDRLWLAWLPMIAGLGWFAWYWTSHRTVWHWRERMPALLIASFLTASYGVWQFDLVVLLVPVVAAATVVAKTHDPALARFALTLLVGFDLLAVLLMNVRYTDQYWHVWMTPAVLYGYWKLAADDKLRTAHG